jgi:hypothetical protein
VIGADRLAAPGESASGNVVGFRRAARAGES